MGPDINDAKRQEDIDKSATTLVAVNSTEIVTSRASPRGETIVSGE